MLSILIVDDEKIASADILYKVSKSGFIFKWVMEASSAEEALDIITEHKPDILLTDIMMGEMTGIDLVKAARKCVPDIIPVLISGYSEFSYAKEAIALGVVDYLLKPVRQDELTGVLSKVIAKGIHPTSINYEKSMDDLLSEEQKEQLIAFLNGIKTNLDFLPTTLFPDTAKVFQIGIFRLSVNAPCMEESKTLPHNSITGNQGEYNDITDDQGAHSGIIVERSKDWLPYDRLRQQVQEIIREIGGEWIQTFNNFAKCQQIIVIAAAPILNYQKAEVLLAKYFDEIFRQIHNRLEITLNAGVSEIADSISSIMMTQARQALDIRFSLKCNLGKRVFYWSEWEKLARPNLPEEDFKLYQSMLVAGDLKQALATVRRIFSSDTAGTAMHIRMLYIELICILARTCIKKAGGSVVSMLGTECLSGGIIDEFSNRQELIESLCRTITTVLSQWMAVTADARSVLLIVKRYIENNYTNSELCTNLLSKQFCISLGYLSTTFNKEFDVTVTKYIITLRMDYAKKLLKETQLSINDIAENCGFNNLSYFMRTFKKYVGCTPNDFRSN